MKAPFRPVALSLILACLFLVNQATAANVGSAGYTTTFGAQPDAADWATLSIVGGGNDVYPMDTEVLTNTLFTVANVTAQCNVSNVVRPTAVSVAVWSTSGYLQTRPTGNKYTILMGKFVNTSGSNVTQISIAYTLDMSATTPVTEDAGHGHRVYYSLTGLANSWTNIPAFNNENNVGSFTPSTSLALNWPNGGNFYLAFTDDNAGPGTDDANQIDNFSIAITGGAPPASTITLTSPANGASAAAPATISLTSSPSVPGGTTVSNVAYYYTNNGVTTFVGTSAAGPTYPVSAVGLGVGKYGFYAYLTNSLGGIANAATNVVTVTLNSSVTLISPANGASFTSLDGISVSANAVGASIQDVKFFIDGGLSNTIAGAGPYSYTLPGTALSNGTHTIYARMTDSISGITNSVTNTFTVIGPIQVAAVGITNSFAAVPPRSQWSSFSVPGTSDGSHTNNSYAILDSGMAVYAAASITNTLPSLGSDAKNALAYWRSDFGKITTQPTGNQSTLLMVTLQNKTGAGVSEVAVAYTLSSTNAATEQLMGHRVYYSLTGAANSWTAVGNFALSTIPGSSNMVFVVRGLNWAADALLYLVWLDDNGSNTDGNWMIDDISFTPVSSGLSIALTAPTVGSLFGAPATVSLTSGANPGPGATVSNVTYYYATNGVQTYVGTSASGPAYPVSASSLGVGSYGFYAFLTNSLGAVTNSSTNLVTILSSILTRGPYLQSGSPTGAVVRWRTTSATNAVVFYGTNATNLSFSATQATSTNNHIVTLSGLTPGTKYFYSIAATAGETLAGGTNTGGTNFWFKTSPVAGTRQPARLWVLGDAGRADNYQRAVRDAYQAFAATSRPADLWLMLGDNAYNSGTDPEYQSAVFDMYPDTLRNLFLWPVIGNHESAQSYTATSFPYLDIFSTPTNGQSGGLASGNKKYYSFDYANIHFVALDSMTSGRSQTNAMASWLTNDLAATSQEWVIVFFHHPAYTKGSHNSDSETDLTEVRQNLVPLLESYGVDLVLSGHSHAYERSFLLDGHYGISSTLTEAMKIDGGDGRVDGNGAYQKNTNGQGVVYTVAGSSGQTGGGTLNHPAHFISLNQLGSVIIDVASNRLDMMFLTSGGATNDHVTLVKVDDYTPSIVVTAPLNGSGIVNPPGTLTLSATATAGIPNTMTGVGFYATNNGSVIFLASVAGAGPYSISSPVLPAGIYGVYAIGTNSVAATFTSATNVLNVSLPLDSLIFVQQPSDAPVAAVIAPEIRVEARDLANAPMVGIPITLSLNGGGVLGGTVTRNADGAGIAHFANLTVSTAGSKTLTAITAGSGLTAISISFSITNAPPIFVGPAGSGTNGFNSVPFVTQWSTVNIPGLHNATRLDSDWDACLSTNGISIITSPLSSAIAAVPPTSPTAQWRSDLQRIQTAPTSPGSGSSAALLLMATLNNASGGPINYLDVAYVMSEYRTDFTPTEARMGHRIYYSLTGAANSWTAFGNVNIAAKTTNNISLTLTNLGWANNSPLYVVWLDEDGTSQDGLFGLDDISFTAHPSSPVLALATNSSPSFTALALTIAPVNAPVPVGVVGTPVSNLVVNVTDVDSGGVTGIAITTTDETHGTFYFSTNNGIGWSLVGSVSGGSARLVATAQGRIYFKPAPGYTGSITNALTFRAWDLSSGVNGGLGNASVNGGNTAYSAAMDAANQTVNPVNLVPSFTKGADQNVAEDAGVQTVPGWATAISAGAISESNQVVNFIVTNNNNSLFSSQPAVSATGTLTYTPATNVSGSTLVSVQIHDDGGTTPGVDTSAAQTFLITVTAVNDAPVLGLPSSAFAPAFALAWGSSGSGNGQFSSPWSVAVDGGGNVYVGELGNNRIQKFDSSGNYITKWGSSGSGNGQFSSPYGVAVDSSGNVYVAEYGNNRIQKFTSGGSYVTQWGTSGSGNGQFSGPTGVAVDGSGNVYVMDYGNNRVQKFDSSGTYITKWGSYGSGDGQFQYALGLAADGSGNVYVVDNNNSRIQKFDGVGAFLTKWGTGGSGDGQFSSPYGAAVDGGGHVYVADTYNYRLQEFDSSGTFITQWGSYGTTNGQFNTPTGVAVDGNGNIYVVDHGNERVQKFTPSSLASSLTIVPVNAPVPVGAVGTAVSTLVGNVTDADSGAVTGIAIAAIDETFGTLYFSTNNGASWSLVGPVSGSSARLVATAQGRVYFKPTPNFSGTVTNVLTIRAWDLTSGVNGGLADASINGGITAFSSATNAVNQLVNPVNLVPSFTKGPNQTVLEDATAQSVPVWATAISPGAISESNQVVNFIVSNNNNALFTSQPTVSATGTLTYTPATNANGSALVSVQIHDNGGTNPGVDISAVQTFTINVTPVNDLPGFKLKLAQASASIENFDSVTVPNLPAGWTTTFSPASTAWKTLNTSSDSAPNTAFAPNVNSEDTSLFSTAITIPNSGSTLTFRHSYYVESYYDGGILEIAIGGGAFQEIISAGGSFVSGGYNEPLGRLGPQWSGNSGGFVTTVVTLPPAASDQSVQFRWRLRSDSSVVYTGWFVDSISASLPPVVTVGQNSGPYSQPNIATNLSVGPANESGQVINFIVTNGNNALFSSQPVVSAAGTLSFTPAADVAGSALVSVQIHDDAGVLNGGVDTSASQTFTILVVPRPVLSPPVFTNLTNVLLTWSSISGGVYRLQYLPALAPTNAINWLTLAGDVTATGSFSSKLHTNGQAAGTNRMFYRVLMP